MTEARMTSPVSGREPETIGNEVFLVGAERSGTTLLRIMLDHHPLLAFRNEFEFAVDLVSDDGRFPPLPVYYEHLRMSRTFAMSGFEIDRGLDYPSLVRSFLEQKRARDGKSLVGATVHRHFHRLLTIWPDARFIHIIRDGRDVARSRVREGWAGNGWVAAHEWVSAEEEIERLAGIVGPERVLDVRYECLLADPEDTLDRVCGFIGLAYSPAMLDIEDSSSYKRPDPRFAQRWKSGAGEREIALIEDVQSDMLARRGYEPSGYRPRRPGWVGGAWLRWNSRFGRLRFRIGRYGVRLCLTEIIARRFGPRGLRERTQLAMNEIQKRHLK
ncbi:MAG: sulfotransferase [Phycisphaerales bacterium]|nr:sulfotransferase [Phycisphaerales bacterium]